MTQGDPLPPTILSMVMEEVVQHWEVVVEERLGVQEGCGWEGRHQTPLFYVDDGMVASTEPEWLQGASDTLIGMFN